MANRGNKPAALILGIFFVGAVLIGSVASAAGYQDTVDDDGCWDAQTRVGERCVVVDNTKWGGSDGNKLYVRYKNRCEHRIYMTKCNKQNNGDWSCGADGVNGGGFSGWSTHNASGDYEWVSIGSVDPGQDWVCAGKHRYWDDVGD